MTPRSIATLYRSLLVRQRKVDELSPAARAAEEREIDRQAARLDVELERLHRHAVRPLPNLAAGGPDEGAVRELLERANVRAVELLAAQGDQPDRELLRLQHDLAEFLHPQPKTAIAS